MMRKLVRATTALAVAATLVVASGGGIAFARLMNGTITPSSQSLPTDVTSAAWTISGQPDGGPGGANATFYYGDGQSKAITSTSSWVDTPSHAFAWCGGTVKTYTQQLKDATQTVQASSTAKFTKSSAWC